MARLREWLDFHPGMRIAMRPLAAVLLLGAGFAVGLQQRPHTAVGAEQRVRLVRPAQDGQVEMVIDEVIQKKLRGPVEDVAIRKLLMSAAHDPDDPALRAEVLDVLKGGSEALDVRNSLISSLEKDPSSEVRMKALEALRPYAAFPDVRRAISKTLLGDLNSEVRILAIDTLVSVDQPDVAGTLQKLLESEPNQYLRQRSQAALVAMKASTDTF